MKRIAIAFAALALAACGQAATTTATTETAATTVQETQTPAAFAPADAHAALIGRWGDNGDCNKDIRFNADGTFASYTGGGGTWTLNGTQLTLSGSGGAFDLSLAWLDNDHMITTDANGVVGTSQRC